MIYCFDKTLPFSYSKPEMIIGKKNGNSILYDPLKKVFENFEGNIIDIKGELIFPRTGANQIYEMNEEIVKKGGIPIVSTKQIEMVLNWVNYYKPKRKMEIIKGSELIDSDKIIQIEKEYGENIFIKTKTKNFSDNISTALLKDKECVFYKALEYHLQDDFIISESVVPSKDCYGIKEYRCFVINDEVYNISRYTDDLLHRIDESVLKKANQVVEMMKGIFPSCYSFDLFEYVKDGELTIDVVEFNPIHATGLYLYNTIFIKSNDILHNDINTISEEFLKNINELKTEGCLIDRRSNLYYPNTFAGDIRSIFLIGTRGLAHARNFELSSSALGKHPNQLEVMKFTDSISSEQQLKDDNIFKKDNSKQDTLLQEKLKQMVLNKQKYKKDEGSI